MSPEDVCLGGILSAGDAFCQHLLQWEQKRKCCTYDQNWMFLVFMLAVTPSSGRISFFLRDVAPNFNKNFARCKPHFCTRAVSSLEELLLKFKAGAPSSMWPSLLHYNLSACTAAGAHQFNWAEIWGRAGKPSRRGRKRVWEQTRDPVPQRNIIAIVRQCTTFWWW